MNRISPINDRFTRIFQDHEKLLRSTASKYLNPGHRFMLDDVLQEIRLRAFRSLAGGKFRGDSALSTYLFAIARNEALRMNRRLNGEARRLVHAADVSVEIPDQREGAPETVARGMDAGRIHDALGDLPPRYRDVMRAYCAGDSHQAIAMNSGLKIGTVKSRIHYGKLKMRALLGMI